ncbi:MAG: protein kinase, partial [Acidobacteria bacterium]|nr:protein kinase [Acidobacteriota bacterium]
MSPEQWQQTKYLFNILIELTQDERAARLASESDAEISAAVEKLLAADAADNFEETPVANLAYLWREDEEDKEIENFIGRRIGNYTVIREIGRGGMGIVFEANRSGGDFSKSVALKLLKRGMDSGAMLRRFRSERQILASLEHSNIARLLDGGMSDDGLPFFALELIEGEPLDKYCRTENLSIP